MPDCRSRRGIGVRHGPDTPGPRGDRDASAGEACLPARRACAIQFPKQCHDGSVSSAGDILSPTAITSQRYTHRWRLRRRSQCHQVPERKPIIHGETSCDAQEGSNVSRYLASRWNCRATSGSCMSRYSRSSSISTRCRLRPTRFRSRYAAGAVASRRRGGSGRTVFWTMSAAERFVWVNSMVP